MDGSSQISPSRLKAIREMLDQSGYGEIARRGDIFNKTKGHCTYCECLLNWAEYGNRNVPAIQAILTGYGWCEDHDIPEAHQGSNLVENLWPACYYCNEQKSDKTGREYLAHRVRFGMQINSMWK